MCVGADNFVLFCGWKRKTVQAEKTIPEHQFFTHVIKECFKPHCQKMQALYRKTVKFHSIATL